MKLLQALSFIIGIGFITWGTNWKVGVGVFFTMTILKWVDE